MADKLNWLSDSKYSKSSNSTLRNIYNLIQQIKESTGLSNEEALEYAKDYGYLSKDAYDVATGQTSFSQDWKDILGKVANTIDSPEDFLRDYTEYQDLFNEIGYRPEDYSGQELEAINQVEQQRIQDEVDRLMGDLDANYNNTMSLYDQALNRSTNAFQTELNNSNQAYNDYSNQILSNQAYANNSLQGSMRSELDRSQRNAIVRGANAAMRLVNNVNTELGLQNRAASNALNTSNNLAQSLLNQRQAAASMRSNYTNTLNQDTYRRAEAMDTLTSSRLKLQNGLTERKNEAGRNAVDYAVTLRHAGQDAWDSIADTRLGETNGLSGAFYKQYGAKKSSTQNNGGI